MRRCAVASAPPTFTQIRRALRGWLTPLAQAGAACNPSAPATLIRTTWPDKATKLRSIVDQHNRKTQSERKKPVLPEYRDWGVQRQHGKRADAFLYPGDVPPSLVHELFVPDDTGQPPPSIPNPNAIDVRGSDGTWKRPIISQTGNYVQCNLAELIAHA